MLEIPKYKSFKPLFLLYKILRACNLSVFKRVNKNV